MKKGCPFDEPYRGLHYDSSNETSHYYGSSKGNHLGSDFGVDHLGGSYTEVMSSFWDLETIGITCRQLFETHKNE